MQEQIAGIRTECLQALEKVSSLNELEQLRVAVLGKKGSLTGLLRGMGQVDPALRPMVGQWINQAREELEGSLSAREEALRSDALRKRLLDEAIDVTQPGLLPRAGVRHPGTMVLDQVIDCFVGLGFEVVEGPQIELDHYNFELLNIPRNHPARDAQDTFYIDDNTVLRTHTSPVQARVMTTRKPPIRVVCPGRVYRADEVDATHSPVFHQIEGLVIDEHITMADLRGTLDAFAKRLYGEDIATRFRPSFFPFTEPSAEVDLTCFNCRGKGCRVCKGTGWIEVLGSGMVNPKVLEMCGIDSSKYSGFAFGIGLERITMLRYGIPDMRLMYEGDERFLRQFR
ncbi:MAG: phenylalanine--tRNA ligase subunit alpha [Clostridia bacterium]|nr:phenylalanine--tRNA ligase subunit alpha [Clostridia bacterium]